MYSGRYNNCRNGENYVQVHVKWYWKVGLMAVVVYYMDASARHGGGREDGSSSDNV